MKTRIAAEGVGQQILAHKINSRLGQQSDGSTFMNDSNCRRQTSGSMDVTQTTRFACASILLALLWGGVLIDGILTVTSVDQIRPDDHLLRETKDAQSASLQRRIENVARVGHHIFALENTQTDQVDFRPMEQQPTISHLLFPSNVARIFPQ